MTSSAVRTCAIVLLALLFVPACKTQSVMMTGADRVVADHGMLFAGKRVGLVTNQTGQLADGRFLVDALLDSGIRVTALFGPEHGIRGDAGAGEKVHDSVDVKTGVPVFSLYGKTSKPTPEMLANVDVLVYDIQDVGVRFYTYISTMKLCMEAAAEQGIPFIVLDRPNPLGELIDGPVIEDSLRSFVGIVRIPIVYGLTIGELATMINDMGWLANGKKARLEVVWMDGWTRSMRLTTPWVPPSPNIRRPETIDLYPGLCLIEATNLSEGRGTEQPFHQFGAPWVNAKQLAHRLNTSGLQGIRFAPAKFTPSSSKNTGLVCHGVSALVTDPDKFQPVLTGVTVLSVLRSMYPDSLVIRRASLNRLFGVAGAYDAIHKGVPAAQIELGWQDGLKEYKELAARFRRYPQQ
jgi:uncharacterized protein YbbC (DUF1343 family)